MIRRRSDFEWTYFLCLQFPRSEAKSHTQTHIESHLNLALRGLEATQHQVHELVIVVKDQSQQIERLISKDKEQSQQIERQSQQIKEQSQQIERLISKDKEQSQQIERQSSQIEKLMSKDKEQSEIKREAMSTVQDQSQQIERRELIDQGLPTPFEWKIPNIREVSYRRAQYGPQILVCEPFYLSQRGYKYLLKIEVVNIFLRLSIKVVPGEFDGLLSWPCKEKVRVTVNGLNKLRGTERNSSNVVFDFAESSEPWPRPLHDDHHEYRLILQVRHSSLLSRFHPDLLIKVNRE